jgi:hypothetical protein
VGRQVGFLQSTSIAGREEDACLEHIYCSRYTAQCLRSARFARASCFETLHALVETQSTALNYRLHGIMTLGVERRRHVEQHAAFVDAAAYVRSG